MFPKRQKENDALPHSTIQRGFISFVSFTDTFHRAHSHAHTRVSNTTTRPTG